MCDQCDARTEYAPARMAARARAAAQQLGAEIKTSAAVDAAGQQPAIGLRHRLPGIELTLDEGMLATDRSEEHTSELQSLMRISYAVFCLKKKKHSITQYKRKNKQ